MKGIIETQLEAAAAVRGLTLREVARVWKDRDPPLPIAVLLPRPGELRRIWRRITSKPITMLCEHCGYPREGDPGALARENRSGGDFCHGSYTSFSDPNRKSCVILTHRLG